MQKKKKKILTGSKLSKAQREQLNKTKANVNKLHAYLTKKKKVHANKKNVYQPKLIKTQKDLINNVNNTLSNIKKNMPRKSIYKFKRTLKGFINKLSSDNQLSKQLYDQLNKTNVNTSSDFYYFRLTKKRSVFNDRYL